MTLGELPDEDESVVDTSPLIERRGAVVALLSQRR